MAIKIPLFKIYVVGLWAAIALLGLITALAYTVSFIRSSCSSPSGHITIFNVPCTPQESISSVMHRHTSYFQSVHIIIIQGVVVLSLPVLRPSLWAMIWTALEKKDGESAASDWKLTLHGLGDGRCHIDRLLKLAVKHFRHHGVVAFVPITRLSRPRGLLPHCAIPYFTHHRFTNLPTPYQPLLCSGHARCRRR